MSKVTKVYTMILDNMNTNVLSSITACIKLKLSAILIIVYIT